MTTARADGPQPRRHAGHARTSRARATSTSVPPPWPACSSTRASPTTWRPTPTTAAIRRRSTCRRSPTPSASSSARGSARRRCRTTPTRTGAGRRHLDGDVHVRCRPRPRRDAHPATVSPGDTMAIDVTADVDRLCRGRDAVRQDHAHPERLGRPLGDHAGRRRALVRRPARRRRVRDPARRRLAARAGHPVDRGHRVHRVDGRPGEGHADRRLAQRGPDQRRPLRRPRPGRRPPRRPSRPAPAGWWPRSSRRRCPTSTCSSAPARRRASTPRSACRRRGATSSTAISRIPRRAPGGSLIQNWEGTDAQPDDIRPRHRGRGRRRRQRRRGGPVRAHPAGAALRRARALGPARVRRPATSGTAPRSSARRRRPRATSGRSR